MCAAINGTIANLQGTTLSQYLHARHTCPLSMAGIVCTCSDANFGACKRGVTHSNDFPLPCAKAGTKWHRHTCSSDSHTLVKLSQTKHVRSSRIQSTSASEFARFYQHRLNQNYKLHSSSTNSTCTVLSKCKRTMFVESDTVAESSSQSKA